MVNRWLTVWLTVVNRWLTVGLNDTNKTKGGKTRAMIFFPNLRDSELLKTTFLTVLAKSLFQRT